LLFLAALVLAGAAVFRGKGKNADGRPEPALSLAATNGSATTGQGGQGMNQPAAGTTSQRSAMDQRFVGVWAEEAFGRDSGIGGNTLVVSTHRRISIWENGQFIDRTTSSFSHPDGTGFSEDSQPGWVELRGKTLVFKYDNGNQWTATYEIYSNGMKLNGAIFVKQ
jgi:hypothetical protein